ncbi:hypothetical protein BN80_073 [Yersinia phage phiR1-RT]|uniref:Uncharacterized protein n=2 Tax=Tegunavirus TaxID=1921704 RepID=A0A0B5A494_9CAUD|nr:hypothetical protein BN80_073 [Yersinia phage phiR1-RT]YP_009200338.1 hypothetical protein AVV33_gp077 [Yersinia phage vB_YenM_TG1]AJD81886.1 hypothetical protein YenMTG1_077 [Yersinia phage vB_YenM_TG1]CCI88647.1 hypothetical protein BN80_073 [Yersinia phage phiR1-RT]
MIVSSKANYDFAILLNAYDRITVKIEVEDSFITIRTNGLMTYVRGSSDKVAQTIISLNPCISMADASVIASKIK